MVNFLAEILPIYRGFLMLKQLIFNAYPYIVLTPLIIITLLKPNQQTPQLAQFAFYLKVFDDEA